MGRFGKEFIIISKAKVLFGLGDRVKGKESGKMGMVLAVDSDGDPKVRMGGESDGQQRYGTEFTLVSKGKYAEGDRVKGVDSGKLGTVISVDEDGDPKVKYDDEEDAVQRFGKEFVITEKSNQNWSVVEKKESKKDKKKKK